jgi:hypothetical protein
VRPRWSLHAAPTNGRSAFMRTLVIAGLIVGGVAIFAPNQGAGLMRSVVHGFGWGIGREVAHSLFGHHRW